MIENILNKIYSTNPYTSSLKNKTKFNPITQGSDIYGEVTKKGTNDLVNYFKDYFNENTIFYDLGSGLGKMVLHIGLKYNIKKSIGIELSKERYQGAIDLKNQYAPNHINIEFYRKSYFTHNIKDANIIYCDNTAMEKDLNIKIYNLIPSGCLYLFKRNDWGLDKNKYRIEKYLVDRTYGQKKLCWLIKE